MSNDSYFDTTLASENFFDEGPRLPRRDPDVLVNTGSINTADIDGYRQGVSITTWKSYGKGTVKIWSGEEGHQPKKNTFGQSGNAFGDKVNTTFQDKDIWDSVRYLQAQENVNDLSDVFAANVFTWPIVIGDNDQLQNNNFNGVIEPLAIREEAGFFSIDTPYIAHSVYGQLMGGNEDYKRAADQVSQFFYYDRVDQNYQTTAYLDMGYENAILDTLPTMGYILNEQSLIEPFSDRNLIAGREAEDINIDEGNSVTINEAQQEMNPSENNYIPSKMLSAATGFTYDYSVTKGVDSIAFSGETY